MKKKIANKKKKGKEKKKFTAFFVLAELFLRRDSLALPIQQTRHVNHLRNPSAADHPLPFSRHLSLGIFLNRGVIRATTPL